MGNKHFTKEDVGCRDWKGAEGASEILVIMLVTWCVYFKKPSN